MTSSSVERTVWQGTPSQAVNVPSYLLLGLVAVVATVVLLAFRNSSADGGAVTGGSNSVFVWLLVAVWSVCVILVLAQYLKVRSERYLITSERLKITTGLFSTATEEVELRRVRDTSVVKPFLLRLLGLGNVHIVSADLSAPRVTLRAVRDPDGLQSTIRDLVQGLYRRHGVREVDVM